MLLNYTKYTVRAAAILTGSYVAGDVIGPGQTANPQGDNPANNNQLIAYVSFTKGSLTSLEVKVEFSHDGTTYYQQTGVAYSAGTTTAVLNAYTTTTTGNYRLEIPIKDNYIKISVKGTGDTTGSSCSVDAVVGVV